MVHKGDLDDVQLLLQEGGGEEVRDYGRILEVTISYFLDRAPSGLTAGYVYRQPYSDPDDQRQGQEQSRSGQNRDIAEKRKKNGENGINGRDRITPVACSIYSIGGGVGTLRDLDGVRCWLPCIDSPDQRAVFDITLHYPSHMQVMTCGKKISSNLSSVAPSVKKMRGARRSSRSSGLESSKKDAVSYSTIFPLEHCFTTHSPRCAGHAAPSLTSNVIQRDITSSRFFSVTRLPAMSIGFFVGQVKYDTI